MVELGRLALHGTPRPLRNEPAQIDGGADAALCQGSRWTVRDHIRRWPDDPPEDSLGSAEAGNGWSDDGGREHVPHDRWDRHGGPSRRSGPRGNLGGGYVPLPRRVVVAHTGPRARPSGY